MAEAERTERTRQTPRTPRRLSGAQAAVRAAEQLVELYPDARKVIVDDSWTLIPEDQPEMMAQLLRDFVG